MGCWRLGLCVQGGEAKAMTPVRRWGAWGRGEDVEGGGSELAGHSSTFIWGLLGHFLELARETPRMYPNVAVPRWAWWG